MDKAPVIDPEWKHNIVTTPDGIQLHYVEAGPSDGLPVVMAHGWPDLWFGWRHQMQALSPKYRLIVPDMRGYGLSSAPQNAEAYGTKKNVDDLAALLDALNIPKAVFLGHDWGGKFVWRMCLFHPERVIAACSLCWAYIPPLRELITLADFVELHPQLDYMLWLEDSETAAKSLDNSPERLFRSLYRRPREWASYPGIMPLRGMLENVGTGLEHPVYTDPSTIMTEEEVQYYVDTYSRAKFTGSCLGYATTKTNYETELELPDVIPHKALYIAAAGDPVLKPEMAVDMAKYMPNLSTVVVENAGHWVHMEQKEKVNEILVEWLATIEAH